VFNILLKVNFQNIFFIKKYIKIIFLKNIFKQFKNTKKILFKKIQILTKQKIKLKLKWNALKAKGERDVRIFGVDNLQA
jgi:hypothetical protein